MPESDGICDSALIDYVEWMNEEFWNELCELNITVPRTSPFELVLADDMRNAVYGTSDYLKALRFTPGEGCFKRTTVRKDDSYEALV